MKSEVIYDDGNHQWIFLGRDPEKKTSVIDTNQYIIMHDGQAMLLDPGGIEIFPQVLTEMTKHISTDNIKSIFCSHQDPDIASSLSMWVDLSPKIQIYCSWIWSGFLTHFGMGSDLSIVSVPDDGAEIQIGDSNSFVYLVPAHYLHSPGNFSCYDPRANILYSGDIGAALLPDAEAEIFVGDFDKHIVLMELFHKRWLPSKDAVKEWIKRVRFISPEMICPQHGSIFKGDNVGKFLYWLESVDISQWDHGSEQHDMRKCIWAKWKK